MRDVRCMRRVRVMPMVPITMRLSRRGGKGKDRGGDQSRRGEASTPADSESYCYATP